MNIFGHLGRVFLLTLVVLLGWAGCSRKSDVERRLKEAERHYNEHDFERAKIEYINVLRSDATNSEALLRLGKIFYRQGLVTDAAPLIGWSRRRFPDDLELRSQYVELLALLSVRETNRAYVSREINDLLELDPVNEKALFALVGTARDAQGVEAAAQRIRQLRAKAGDRAILKLVEAELVRRRGDTNQCEALLKAAVTAEPTNGTIQYSVANYYLSQRRPVEGEAAFRRAAELVPPESHIRERWGRFLMQNGKLSDARTTFDEINSKAPERVSAWVGRAELALAERKLDEAENFLGRAASLAPADAEALRVLAQLRVAQGRPEDAIRELEKIVVRKQGSASVLYQLGLAHLLNKDPSRAATALEQTLQLQPGFTTASLLLGDLQLSRGDSERAARLARDVISKSPGMEVAHMLLIRAERAAGRIDSAVAAAAAARERFPKSAGMAYEHGVLLRLARRIPEARAAFESALGLGTNNVPVVAQLMAIDLSEQKSDAALRRIQERLELSPNDSALWMLKAELHRKLKDIPATEAAARKAMECNPNNPEAYRVLASLAIEAGRRKDAVRELEQLLKRVPNDANGLLIMATIQTEAGEAAQARQTYERALKAAPNDFRLLNNYASLLLDKFKEVTPGHEAALKARKIAPADPQVADTLGWAEFLRGEYGEALRLLSEASGKLTEEPEVQFHLGMAHYMMGQELPAKSALRAAVDSTREFEGKAMARDYLAMLELDSAKPDGAALRLLEARCKEQPTDLIALSRLGRAYALSGASEKARETYEAALKVNPKSVLVLLHLAELNAGRLNNPLKALELARTARRLAPEDGEVAIDAGRVAYGAGDQAWAYSLLQDGWRQFTNRTDVAISLAWAAFSQGKLDEAARTMQQAVGGNTPDAAARASANTFLQMLAIVRDVNRSPKSATEVQRVLDSDPNHGVALYAYGLLAEAQGQFDGARQAYEKLLAAMPGFMPAVRQLAVLYAERLNEDAKAQEFGLRARQVFTRDDALTAAIGKAVCRRGDFNYAVQLLTEAAPSRAGDAALFYHLGMAYQGLQRRAESREMYKKAIGLDPNAAFVAEARKRLEQVKEP